MIPRLKQSMEALQVLMKAQEVTANNLANINTPGYKADHLFYRAFKNEMLGKAIETPEPYQNISMQQGTLNKTENPFDFAIQGQGFFGVQKNGEVLLKRSGHFRLNPEGFLVDEHGAKMMGTSGPIQLPDSMASLSNDDIQVAENGTISIKGKSYGQIQLLGVKDSKKIEHLGNSYYSAPDGSITTLNQAGDKILQGYLEASNVDPLTGLVDMTKNMRLFQSQQRAMLTTNEVLSRVTNKLGRY